VDSCTTEMEFQIVSVLLGRRLFDHLSADHIEPEA
jgi:hypothetical protein